jgi:hypothetical protein
MMRSTRERSDGFDPERLVVAAVEAFLGGDARAREQEADDGHVRRRVGRGGAVALGVAVGLGARVLYRRARDFDLERAARAVERRIVN